MEAISYSASLNLSSAQKDTFSSNLSTPWVDWFLFIVFCGFILKKILYQVQILQLLNLYRFSKCGFRNIPSKGKEADSIN